MSRTLIVSNRLPTKVQRTEAGLTFQPSEGGLATGLGSIYRTGDNKWIGWPGLFVQEADEQEQITQQLQADSMAPVFLTEAEIQDFYEGFSNSTLWPTFHYFPQYATHDEQHWQAYLAVNQKFCDAVLALAGPDDTIWVHDYQLLLLPQLLRRARPQATIGFFLHIPFPSYELIRVLPWAAELLEGMLGADLIGFHTFGYLRHFMSAVSHMLGLPTQNGQVETSSRTVLVDVFPMGIDYQRYAAAAVSAAAQQYEQSYRLALRQVRVILSVDRLDYTKGIPQRLIAFEELLRRYPEWREQVILIMIVVPSRDQVAQYHALKEEVDELVGRLNAQYGTIAWTPIHYFYRSLPFEELAALYHLADVALVTPIRDGMNLVAKEFIASKTDSPGVLILSERAGAAQELFDALLINPTATGQLVEALHQALRMPVAEQVSRLTNLQAMVRQYDVFAWTELFMNRLTYSKIKQYTLATDTLEADARAQLVHDYCAATRRLLLLDYDGTLLPFHTRPSQARPDPQLLDLLHTLSENPQTQVVITSGRDRATLEHWLGHLRIGLIAEDGLWLRQAGGEWELLQEVRVDWKQDFLPLLEQYVGRTPGALVEEKEYSLVWHYRRADRGLGAVRSRELLNHLSFMTSNTDLQVLEGHQTLEVKSVGLHKGAAALRWLGTEPTDFILAFGDGRADEELFRVLPPDAYTVKVGNARRSLARYCVGTSTEVRRLLETLAAVTVTDDQPTQ